MATIRRNSPYCGNRSTIPLGPALWLRPDPHARSVDRHFAFACVDGSDEIAECYRLRYETYCVERDLIPLEDYPAHLESDAYDAQSLHFLASHLHGEPAGTARLVLNGPLGLPLVSHCTLEPDYGFLADPRHPLSPRYAEVSRLAVSRGFRRRRDDSVYGGPPRPSPQDSLPGFSPDVPPPADVPEMIAGILRLVYQESKRRRLTHWVAAMEQSLQVMLRRMGLPYNPIGPQADYYGPVRPYVAEIATLERNLAAFKPATLDYMVSGLEPLLMPDFMQGSARRGPAEDGLGVPRKAKAA